METSLNGNTLTDDQVSQVIRACKVKVRFGKVDILRELAKRPEVRLAWAISKSNKVPFFPGPSTEWSIAQLRLAYWLSFYTNIESSPERPPTRIVENNEMLDKWLASKAEENESKYENDWRKASSGFKRTAMDEDEVYTLG